MTSILTLASIAGRLECLFSFANRPPTIVECRAFATHHDAQHVFHLLETLDAVLDFFELVPGQTKPGLGGGSPTVEPAEQSLGLSDRHPRLFGQFDEGEAIEDLGFIDPPPALLRGLGDQSFVLVVADRGTRESRLLADLADRQAGHTYSARRR